VIPLSQFSIGHDSLLPEHVVHQSERCVFLPYSQEPCREMVVDYAVRDLSAAKVHQSPLCSFQRGWNGAPLFLPAQFGSYESRLVALEVYFVPETRVG